MSDARPQRVLVTGGAGLIGSTIADRLTSAGGFKIVVYDNLARGRTENIAGTSNAEASPSSRATSETVPCCAK
jgi:UDP-glucose 4-epimerase